MQRWRTRHDIRGICFQGGGEGGMGAQVGIPSFGAQTNANVGLFQVPISLDFLNPSATSTFDPTIYANPNITQGPFSNSLILGPQIGGGQSTSASLFGGGHGSGGGGNVIDNINYAPTTSLTSNLPPPLQGFAQQNILAPMGQQTVAPNMMPMPAPNSPMGMMMNTTQPIAAGGISPTLAGIMALGSQQQQAPPGQQVIPGSASQAGGYDQPQQQRPPMGGGMPGMPQMPMQQQAPPMMGGAPQGMSMMDRLAGAANPMAMALGGGQPTLTAETAQMGKSQPQTLKAGSATTVHPDPMLTATQNDITGKLQQLAGTKDKLTSDTLKQYAKDLEKAEKEAAKKTKVPEKRLGKAKDTTDEVLNKVKDLTTTDGIAKDYNDKVDKIVDSLPPAQQAAYNRAAGIAKSSKLDKAMSIVHRLSRGVVAGFQPYSTGALWEDDMHSQYAKAQDMAVYNAVHKEADKLQGRELEATKAEGEQAARQATQSNEELNRLGTQAQRDKANLREDTSMAYKATSSAIDTNLKALGEMSRIMNEGENQENALINQGLARQRLAVSKGELGVNQGRLGVSQAAEARQERDEPSLIQSRQAETNYKQFLTGSPTIAPPKGFPAPKTKGTETSAYAAALRPLIMAGKITKQQANDAIKYYTAQGMLSAEGE